MDGGEIIHDEVEKNLLLRGVVSFHIHSKTLRVKQTVVRGNDHVGFLGTCARVGDTIGRVDSGATSSVCVGLPADDAHFLPPGGLELNADLD